MDTPENSLLANSKGHSSISEEVEVEEEEEVEEEGEEGEEQLVNAENEQKIVFQLRGVHIYHKHSIYFLVYWNPRIFECKKNVT